MAIGALADNAVRHVRRRITIGCAREGGAVTFRVRDDGSGVE